MTGRRRSARAPALPAIDTVAIAAGFLGAYALRFGGFGLAGASGHTSAHLLLGLALFAAWPPVLYLLDLYEPARFLRPLPLATRVLQAMLLVAVAVAAPLFLFKAQLASRLVLGIAVATTGACVWTVRAGIGRLAARDAAARRVLVVGTGQRAVAVATGLPAAAFVGFVATRAGPHEAHVVGGPEDLPRLLRDRVVDDVVVAAEPNDTAAIERALAACTETGTDLSLALPVPESLLAHAAPVRIPGAWVLRLDGSPRFRAARAGKRIFDVVATLVLLPFALPVLVAAVLAVRSTSRGPAFYAQERVGLRGRRFRMFKVRTMVVGAHARRADLAERGTVDARAFKLRDDPRVTPLGRLLRRYSIDELPQLWNVLRGEMSLVGPRPALPEEVERYDGWQRRRLSVRPGMTGLWQVSGRSELGFDEWMRLDLEYIDRWTPLLDAWILLRTVPAVLSGRGAR